MAVSAQTDGTIYVVQADDWLSKLAEKEYQSASLYPVIVDATNAKATQDARFTYIEDPNSLTVGQRLWIPDQPPPQNQAWPLLAELPTSANALAISQDDKFLATGNGQGNISLWDTETWQLRWQTTVSDSVAQLAFSPDGQTLLSTDFAGQMIGWQIDDGQVTYQVNFDYWATSLDVSINKQVIAAGSLDGQASVLESSDGQMRQTFSHNLMVTDVALAPDGPWLATMTAGSWGPVELFVADFETGEQRSLQRFEGLPNQSNVVFSPDTRWVAASVQANGQIIIWETETWPEVTRLETEANTFIKQIAFSPDGRWLGARTFGPNESQYRLWLWQVSDWALWGQLALADVSHDFEFDSTGEKVIIGLGQGIDYEPSYEGQLWNVASRQQIANLPHQGQVLDVAFSHNGRWAITASNDGSTRIWGKQ